VGIQSVVLENHRDIPVLWGDIVHEFPVDVQLALGDILETGDHAQGCGLPATGRTDKHDEFPVIHRDVRVVNSADTTFVDLTDVLEFYSGHLNLQKELSYSSPC
jgi:hypothetical protein